MKTMKTFLAMVMALSMVACMATTAFAADLSAFDGAGVKIDATDGAGEVPVKLYAEGTTFSVTVPTSLPVSVDANGAVTVATDAKIINNSFGAVKVTDLKVAATGGWALFDYDSADMTAEKVNTKKMAMIINGEKTTGADAISFTAGNWNRMEGKNATDSDELAITYNAKVPAQSAAINGSTVANVTFTVAWDLAE